MNRRNIIKILIGALGALVISGVVLVIIAFNQYKAIKADPIKVLTKNQTTNTSSPQSNQNDQSSPDASQTQELKRITVDGIEYTQKPNMVSLLFCGNDYMSSRAERKLGERTDMIMVCAVDADNKKATLISIPRDTRALVPKIDINTGKATGEDYNKINAAFPFGGGSDHYAYQNLANCVQKLLNNENQFDIPISFHVGLNIDGIPYIADAVGGVSVKLEENFPEIGNKGATVNLKGQKAIDFVRERHAFSSSDIARMGHQQQFMMALAKKVQKLGAANSISKLYGEVTKYVQTDLNTDQMVALATILDKISIDSIEHFTVPGTWKDPFIWPDTNGVKDIILKTYYEKAA